jgi:hypothetical protein
MEFMVVEVLAISGKVHSVRQSLFCVGQPPTVKQLKLMYVLFIGQLDNGKCHACFQVNKSEKSVFL